MANKNVGSDLSQRVQDQLQEVFKDQGRGTKTRVERELGLYEGFFGNPRRGDIGVGILLATLRHLGVNITEFFSEALKPPEVEPEPMPIAEPDRDADPMPIVTSPIAKTIARQWEDEGQ